MLFAKNADRYTARFWGYVRKTDGCWEWTSADNGSGYCTFWTGEAKRYVHRISYEMARGPIPHGHELDHTCRNRRCVNPDHLEPVTHQVNLLRGDTVNARYARRTACNYGHPLSGSNLHIKVDGSRSCRTCGRERAASRRAKLQCQ